MKNAFALAAAVLAIAGHAFAAETNELERTPPLTVDGWASIWFGNGYMSSSGNLSDTRPVTEQDLLLEVRSRDYGWLSLENWAKSNLHGGQDKSHRRFLYIYEGLLTYGYAYEINEKVKLVTDAGGVWDWLIAYKSDPQDEWYWIARQSLENPYVTPYWNALGGIEPYHWGRVRCGLRRSFQVTDTLSVTPMGELIWLSDGLYDMRYGGEPDLRFLGGGFASCWLGFKFNWRFYENWSIWGRYRQYALIDPMARSVVDARDAYNAKLDYPLLNIGIAYSF